ncbi:MAG TPA: acyl-CoA dehydrogenase family protein [Actinomycetes bacterium]|jgi:alkylation response protein AidB-like acyl-CoA dehydrogenase|nr:acyl-CoA dehydrogenase family protein [Actinomycetes bacterium]
MDPYARPIPRQEVVDLAARLVPALAGRAAAYDEADAFADEDFDDLVASGYTAITVPADLGGMGASALDLIAAQSRLAEGSPATALAVNMHLHGVGILAETLRHRVEPFLKQVAAGGAIIAGGFSEPQSGGNWWYQATTAVPVPGGGWRLNGVKTFFTGFPRATHLFLSAAVETEAGREPIAFLVPKPERGIRVLGDWRAMGMRATGSHVIAVDGLEVPPECVVDQGLGVAAGFLLASHWSWPSFASVFLGAAEAAYAHVVEGLPKRRNQALGRSLAELPGVQQAVGEMRMRLDAARATLYAAVARQPDPDPQAHYGRMAATKLFVCQTALEVCTLALRTAGGSAYLRTAPVERLLRDAHAGLLLPPSHDATLEWLGRVELGTGAGP